MARTKSNGLKAGCYNTTKCGPLDSFFVAYGNEDANKQYWQT